MSKNLQPMVLVRGINEIASAIAHRLRVAGIHVVMQEDRPPAVVRRFSSFADALVDGKADLLGITARHLQPSACMASPFAAGEIPILSCAFAEASILHPWVVLVDARMRKRSIPEPQSHLAPLVIGLGPGCRPGNNVDIAIETSWDQLGEIVREGETQPYSGKPRRVLGFARERFSYAPVAGCYSDVRQIGDTVEPGGLIARIDTVDIRATIGGVLRGLLRGPIHVELGAKLADIDPLRRPPLRGIDQRPERIAEAVYTLVNEKGMH